MKATFIILVVTLPVPLLLACAPGKGPAGGIGCSKTSSVLKTPQIRVNTIEEFTQAPSEEKQRNRVIQFFGSEDPLIANNNSPFSQTSRGGLKTTGGYIYFNSRKKGDPLGKFKDQTGQTVGEQSRCSVLVEFPKTLGEVAAPDPNNPSSFPQTTAAIEAFRFPTATEDVKIIRIYTAAHCLDYSLTDSAQLSLFKVIGTELPAPNSAYLDVPIKIPELEAVKSLRKEIKGKIRSGMISEADGEKVINAFRPSARNLDLIFGKDITTSRGKCNVKPENITSTTEQFSCATYHDMAVLDVEISEPLPAENMNALKAIRSKWIEKIKEEEAIGPWMEYVKPPFYSSNQNLPEPNIPRLFMDDILSSSNVDLTLKSDAGHAANPSKCKAFPSYDLIPNCIAPMNACPKQKVTLGLFHPSPANCLEVPLDSSANLAYVRYITRERLRKFSRYNMNSMVKELADGLASAPLNLHQCSNAEGVCSLLSAINSSLGTLIPGMNVVHAQSQFQNEYTTATQYVDASLSIWNPFFAIANSSVIDNTDNIERNGSDPTQPPVIIDKNFLKEVVNPIDFLKLHSNFIILDDQTNNLPDATDMTTHRAFMMVPMAGVVGFDTFYNVNPKPIAIADWSAANAGSGFGKFLSLRVTKDDLDAFFSKSFDGNSMPPGVSLPPATAVFVNPGDSMLLRPLPSKVTLQKGDSGSIFTLDTIPAFALSTVNGEATSGGAAVAAIPIPEDDVGDVMPGGSGNKAGGNTNTVAVSCK